MKTFGEWLDEHHLKLVGGRTYRDDRTAVWYMAVEDLHYREDTERPGYLSHKVSRTPIAGMGASSAYAVVDLYRALAGRKVYIDKGWLAEEARRVVVPYNLEGRA